MLDFISPWWGGFIDQDLSDASGPSTATLWLKPQDPCQSSWCRGYSWVHRNYSSHRTPHALLASIVLGIGDEQACVAWFGAKENSVGFGKERRVNKELFLEQPMHLGAQRRYCCKHHARCPAACNAGDAAARGELRENVGIPSRNALNKMLKKCCAGCEK